MIKVFRNIRMKLLRENKFTRYLVYAIGEIILVTIGILIAINLNAWNAHKKDRKAEQEYYCKLLNDLNLEQIQIQESLQTLDEHIELGRNTLLELYGLSVSKHKLMNDYLIAQRMNSYVPLKVTFDFLIASGDIKLITDEAITSSLSIYFARVEDKVSQMHRNTEALAQRASFGYESFTEFGYQDFAYINESLGPEIVKLLPEVEWNKDPSSKIFKQCVDNLVFVIAMNERMKQHLNYILKEMQTPYGLLQKKCTEGLEL